MSTLLIIGSAVAVIIGLVHAVYVYFQRTKEDPKKLADHPLRVRANIQFEEDGFYLYRQMVHPDVPNLLFIGAAATFSNILTQNLQAR